MPVFYEIFVLYSIDTGRRIPLWTLHNTPVEIYFIETPIASITPRPSLHSNVLSTIPTQSKPHCPYLP